MNAIKKTLKKYFISNDGTISIGALGIACAAILITAGKIWELAPIDYKDLITIGTYFTSGGALVGIYRGIKK